LIRVLLVTEMELVSNMISSVLEDEGDIEIAGRATSVDETLARVPEADVALVSTRLPDDGALRIREVRPHQEIIRSAVRVPLRTPFSS
jgi:DNA-binding NarL/FixJ family response regulator